MMEPAPGFPGWLDERRVDRSVDERSVDERSVDDAMARYARGDDHAFPALYAALHPRVCGFLTRITGSQGLVDDLAQETLLRLHRARGTFALGSPVVPWVFAIARNVCRDQARARRVRPTVVPEPEPEAEVLAEETDDAEAIAMARDTARVVERVLARLPSTQRQAFVLLRRDGLTVHEAASVLGTTTMAVKLRAHRAREALRAELGAE
jgi:RNA polymerase sigma-70 factor (ECF subfamily)